MNREKRWRGARSPIQPLNRRIRPKAQKYPYLLAGLLYCHCGRQLVPANAKSGRYHYYACTDSTHCGNRIKAETIEQAALEKIRTMEIREEVLQAALEKIAEKKREHQNELKPELTSAQATLTELEKKQEKLIDAMLADDLTDNAKFLIQNKLDVLGGQIRNLQSRVEFLKSECSQDLDAYEYAADIIQTFRQVKRNLLLSPENFDLQRQALMVYIDRIEEISEKEFLFRFNYSSSKCTKWHRSLDINELLRITFRVA